MITSSLEAWKCVQGGISTSTLATFLFCVFCNIYSDADILLTATYVCMHLHISDLFLMITLGLSIYMDNQNES